MILPEEITFANPRNYELAKNGLLKLREVFNARKIGWYIAGGTLLGCIRDNNLIPHDEDMDIYVLPGTSLPFARVGLEEAGFTTLKQDYQGFVSLVPHAGCWKARAELPWDVHIDVMLLHERPGQYYIHMDKGPWVGPQIGGHPTFQKQVFPKPPSIIKRTFLGEEFPVPENFEELLTVEYGDWHTVNKAFRYDESPNFEA